MFRLRLPEKQTGLSAGLGGFGWCERRIEVRFVWARRMFGAGLARVWRGFGWCERRSARKQNETWFPAPLSQRGRKPRLRFTHLARGRMGKQGRRRGYQTCPRTTQKTFERISSMQRGSECDFPHRRDESFLQF